MNRFGFSDSTWTAAKSEGKGILSECARWQETIPYSNFVARLRTIQLEPKDVRLDHLLEEISTEEHAAGRGMLSVLVVHKGDDLKPGPGFFALAEHLGYDVGDRDAFWVAEFERVLKAWRV